MRTLRKWGRLTFLWAFVSIVLAWIWAPTYMSFDRRVELNQSVGAQLVAWTGLPVLSNIQVVRYRGNEAALAQAEAEHDSLLAQAERQALEAASLVVIDLPHVEADTPAVTPAIATASPDKTSGGAKFIRVGQ